MRYNKKTKIDFFHNCDVFNYGGSKRATYERVVIIPVSTTLPFIEKQTKITLNQTRAKFYIACTRAKQSGIFVVNRPKKQILLSCDVCLKTLLRSYGGWGYDHLLRNIVPVMHEEGIKQEDIDLMLINNPADFLCGKED